MSRSCCQAFLPFPTFLSGSCYPLSPILPLPHFTYFAVTPSAISTRALHTNSFPVDTLYSVIFLRKWKYFCYASKVGWGCPEGLRIICTVPGTQGTSVNIYWRNKWPIHRGGMDRPPQVTMERLSVLIWLECSVTLGPPFNLFSCGTPWFSSSAFWPSLLTLSCLFLFYLPLEWWCHLPVRLHPNLQTLPRGWLHSCSWLQLPPPRRGWLPNRYVHSAQTLLSPSPYRSLSISVSKFYSLVNYLY